MTDRFLTGQGANRAATGAASELRVCAHFMLAGWHVYRAESPHSPFDLVIYRSGETLRVEVKTLTRVSGRYVTFKDPVNREWDILVVVDGHRVWQFASEGFDYRTAVTSLRRSVDPFTG